MSGACLLQGPTAIRGVGNWRVKETERMYAICTELRKLGATVEEGAAAAALQCQIGPQLYCGKLC